ncbi:hypothetical protein AB0442_20625 [Kitasatospora sp. NPDC085895]|uniref:hypothetical protein n=1 Tax=Kitasatospora sp. NPDC085895 TaxID=3155057 RepID=UPI00344B3EB6
MYLVHAKFLPVPHATFPDDIGELVARGAGPDEAVEHVSVHADAAGGPVLGLYVLASSLVAAERTAAAVCRRAIESVPALRGWSLVRSEVPLIAASGRGHVMPWTDSASRDPFHPF